MKEQDLRDFFHDYRPEIGDNDEFMQRLTKQMDAEDARQQQSRVIPFYRRALPWVAGIAACVAILIGSFALLRNYSTSETDGIANMEVAKTEIQETKPIAEKTTQIQETPVLVQVAKEKVMKEKTKRRRKRNAIVETQNKATQEEPPTIMANDEIDRVVQKQIAANTPDPFQIYEDQAKDIRLRGERLHQEVAMLMKNQ